MSVIEVYLENGFEHDRVTLRANGAEVEEPDVTTRYQIGLASVVKLTVQDGRIAVTVAIPERGLKAEATVDPRTTPYVRVNALGGSLAIQPEAAPPMYA